MGWTRVLSTYTDEGISPFFFILLSINSWWRWRQAKDKRGIEWRDQCVLFLNYISPQSAGENFFPLKDLLTHLSWHFGRQVVIKAEIFNTFFPCQMCYLLLCVKIHIKNVEVVKVAIFEADSILGEKSVKKVEKDRWVVKSKVWKLFFVIFLELFEFLFHFPFCSSLFFKIKISNFSFNHILSSSLKGFLIKFA